MKTFMKKLLYFSLVLGLLMPMTSSHVYAQSGKLSKREKKRLKNKAKDLKRNPAALQEILDSNKDLKKENSELNRKLKSFEGAENQKDDRIAELESTVSQLEMQLDAAKASLDEMSERASQPLRSEDNFDRGIVFKVQIGAFARKRMQVDEETAEDLDLEERDDIQKIVLGKFRDYEQAKEFKQNLRRMGVEDAWIVSYRDGVRIPIKEALNQ